MLEFIPDILYLQMDNCYGQNKNKYTLGFLARLIEEKIFKKVKLSFLLVGHTHEDVDQVFSRFSVWIGQNTVLTMDELMKGFETCYRPRPTAIKMHTVYNFQRWLGVNNVKNHSKPHVFKITLNEKTGKAEVQYKGLSTDKDWIKPGGDGLLLEEGQRQLYTIPSTTDNIDIEKLKTDLTTVYRYYNAEDLKSWWDGYINELYEDEELETTEVQLVEILRQKKINQKSPEEENEVSNTDDAINLPTLKPEIPKVIIGKADRKAAQAIKEVETFEIGSFVICNYDKYPDEFPQLARVISVSDENLELLWYKGAKTTTWKPASRPVKGQRGQREPWTEIVPSIAVMFYDFQLTPLGKLPQHIKEVLDQL
ncbi:uncharacterized protein LOC132713258 [Ruditapes philippinarum]|uniref:uncharacterized protein LOC132713258 n=1 Tax=Ruditapes philippinarum TaxID=129788 RepID=UPI00295BC420|nr:uncharacterized protein LOC132713258 [Ruditapes philippinarum]